MNTTRPPSLRIRFICPNAFVGLGIEQSPRHNSCIKGSIGEWQSFFTGLRQELDFCTGCCCSLQGFPLELKREGSTPYMR